MNMHQWKRRTDNHQSNAWHSSSTWCYFPQRRVRMRLDKEYREANPLHKPRCGFHRRRNPPHLCELSHLKRWCEWRKHCKPRQQRWRHKNRLPRDIFSDLILFDESVVTEIWCESCSNNNTKAVIIVVRREDFVFYPMNHLLRWKTYGVETICIAAHRENAACIVAAIIPG